MGGALTQERGTGIFQNSSFTDFKNHLSTWTHEGLQEGYLQEKKRREEEECLRGQQAFPAENHMVTLYPLRANQCLLQLLNPATAAQKQRQTVHM